MGAKELKTGLLEDRYEDVRLGIHTQEESF